MDTAYLIRVAAAKFPGRVALRGPDEAVTFAELDRCIDRLAGGFLKAGVGADGPVASILLNGPSTVCLYLALARAGITSVPVNYRLTAEEKAYILKDSCAGTLIIDAGVLGEHPDLSEQVPELSRVVEIDPGLSITAAFADFLAEETAGEVEQPIDEGDDATIIYTSGTSGFPKGVVRSHRANLWNAVNSLIGSPRGPADVELFSLPLFGIGFVMQVLPTLLAGGCVILDRVFDAERTWELLERHRVTRAFLAPTMIASLLDVEDHRRFDVTGLRTILVAYEFPERLRRRAFDRFDADFLNMYGLTEAQLSCTSPGEFASDPTSVGRPMGLARIRIVGEDGAPVSPGDVGEIAFEGPSVMTRYHGLAEESAHALRKGMLHTGDLGYLDPEGNLHFAGRSKEIIKSGGFSIDPVEIENVLLELEWVAESAVVGVPDDYWGEMVVGYVATKRPPEEEELRDHCRARLASFKVPKHFVLVDELPKNPTGKIQRGVLKTDWRERAGGSP